MATKSPDAFRTIGEVAQWLGVPPHVLRFWESKFSQVRPVKKAGGRRYYRPGDMMLLGGIKVLLHDKGMTIRGVQKILEEDGLDAVGAHAPDLEGGDGSTNGVARRPEPDEPEGVGSPRRTREETADLFEPDDLHPVANGSEEPAPAPDMPTMAAPAAADPVRDGPDEAAGSAAEPAARDEPVAIGEREDDPPARPEAEDDGPGTGDGAPEPAMLIEAAGIEVPRDEEERPRRIEEAIGHADAAGSDGSLPAPGHAEGPGAGDETPAGAVDAGGEPGPSAAPMHGEAPHGSAPTGHDDVRIELPPPAGGPIFRPRTEEPDPSPEPDVVEEHVVAQAEASSEPAASPGPGSRAHGSATVAEGNDGPPPMPEWRGDAGAWRPRIRSEAVRANNDVILALVRRLEAIRDRIGP